MKEKNLERSILDKLKNKITLTVFHKNMTLRAGNMDQSVTTSA
jgi:hypothetical protein